MLGSGSGFELWTHAYLLPNANSSRNPNPWIIMEIMSLSKEGCLFYPSENTVTTPVYHIKRDTEPVWGRIKTKTEANLL